MKTRDVIWLPISSLRIATAGWVLLAALVALSLGNDSAKAAESSQMQVIFFPSVASVSDNGEGLMAIQGRVFTPAQGTHAGLAWLAARKFKIKRTDEPFFSRAQFFF